MRFLAILMSICLSIPSPVIATSVNPVDRTINVISNSIKNTFDTVVDTIGDVADTTATAIKNAFNSLGINDYSYNPSNDKFVNSPRYIDNYSYTNQMNDYSVNYYTTNKNFTNNNNINVPISYNTVNNNYRIELPDYNFTTNNVYNNENNYYSYDIDNNYFYSVTNNDTNIIYTTYNYITYDYEVYVCYFMTPNGQNSYNLTASDVNGIIFSYDVYNYSQVLENEDVLAIFNFDGSFENSVPNSTISLSYGSSTFIDGKYQGALKLDSTTSDLELNFVPDSDYTLEFDFYNGVNGYNELTPNTWTHCVYYYDYDNNTWRTFFNGVEKNHGVVRDPNYYLNISCDMSPNSSTVSKIYTSYNSSAWNTYKKINNNTSYLVFGVPFAMNGSNSTYTSIGDSINLVNSTISPNSDYVMVRTPTYNSLIGLYSYEGSQRGTSWKNYFLADSSDTIFHSSPYLDESGIHFYGTSYTSKSRPTPTMSIVANIDLVKLQAMKTYNGESLTSSYNYYDVSLFNLSTPISSISHNVGFVDKTSYNGFDLRNSAIDNMRICKGFIYGNNLENYVAPNAPFSLGFIHVPPLGSFNNGDVAILSSVTVNRLRVGGAIFSLPLVGDVYIQIDEKGKSYYALQYYDGKWNECDFSVWNGLRWQAGFDFNFYSLSFTSDNPNYPTLPGDSVYNYTIDNNDYNYTYNNQNFSIKESFGLVKGFLLAIVAFVTSSITMFSFLPVWFVSLVLVCIAILVPLGLFILVKKILF